MDPVILAAIIGLIGVIVGAVLALGGTLLQSYLGHRQARDRILLESRKAVYSRLLFAVVSEDAYPPDFVPLGVFNINSQDEVAMYNEKVNVWRKGRKNLKAVASEVLLLTENSELRRILKEFIRSNDPDHKPVGIESLMREELGIKA